MARWGLMMTTPQSGLGRPIVSDNRTSVPSWRSISNSVTALESHLGDPGRPELGFSFARSLQHDELEDYPLAAQASLDDWALTDHLIPVDLGGRLRTTEELLALIRVVARRDLTVAISFGANLLAALPVWIAGTTSQRQAVAEILRSRRGLALAVTERGHGSDLLANGFRADPVDEGFRLSGEKWLILNARRSAAMVVFARTRRSSALGVSLSSCSTRSDWIRPPGSTCRGSRHSGCEGLMSPVSDSVRVSCPVMRWSARRDGHMKRCK